jgi:hypothetical protein
MGFMSKFTKRDTKESKKQISTESIKKELHEDTKQITGQAKKIKHLWKSKDIVQLKTDSIVVLFKKRGYENQFFAEFEKITLEGYQLVLMEPVKAIDAGPIDIQIGNYYYFQNKKFIK